MYECETSISVETTNVATVDANDASDFHVSDTDTVTVIANESPSVSIDPSSGEICDGDSFEFCAVATGGTPPYTYAWEKDGSFFAGDVECIIVSSAGEYCVIVTDSLGCVSPEACATLIVNENPTCELAEVSAPVCPSVGGNFVTATVSGGTPGYTYFWSVEGAGWSIVGGEDTDTVEYAIAEVADICALFTLVVVDSKGCGTVCEVEVCCVPAIFCRFTGGGVDTDMNWNHELEDGEMVRNGSGNLPEGIDRAQFGGQAGAKTAQQPQPSGEWTHNQQIHRLTGFDNK